MDMKTKEEIEARIVSTQEEIDTLHCDINATREKYGGVPAEELKDFHDDIGYKSYEIKILEWVLGRRSLKSI